MIDSLEWTRWTVQAVVTTIHSDTSISVKKSIASVTNINDIHEGYRLFQLVIKIMAIKEE
jgi:hypothetical protein